MYQIISMFVNLYNTFICHVRCTVYKLCWFNKGRHKKNLRIYRPVRKFWAPPPVTAKKIQNSLKHKTVPKKHILLIFSSKYIFFHSRAFCFFKKKTILVADWGLTLSPFMNRSVILGSFYAFPDGPTVRPKKVKYFSMLPLHQVILLKMFTKCFVLF